MSSKYRPPRMAVSAQPMAPSKQDRNGFWFSDDLKKWCPGTKLSIPHNEKRGLRRIGNNVFRKMNDAISFRKAEY